MRASVTASLYTWVSSSQSMPDSLSWKLSTTVRGMSKSPQQWLNAAYLPVSPNLVSRSLITLPSLGPISKTLLGSRVSPLWHDLWFSSHRSRQSSKNLRLFWLRVSRLGCFSRARPGKYGMTEAFKCQHVGCERTEEYFYHEDCKAAGWRIPSGLALKIQWG